MAPPRAGLLPSQIRAAKAAIDPTTAGDLLESDLRVELAALGNVYPAPDAVVRRMSRALHDGLQTPAAERELEATLDRY